MMDALIRKLESATEGLKSAHEEMIRHETFGWPNSLQDALDKIAEVIAALKARSQP